MTAALPWYDLWSDEVEALIDAGFATVSRNPSDHETVVAYRTAIALALAAATGTAKTPITEALRLKALMDNIHTAGGKITVKFPKGTAQ